MNTRAMLLLTDKNIGDIIRAIQGMEAPVVQE